MSEVGVIVPFLKVYFAWHICGICILLLVSYFLVKIVKKGQAGSEKG